MAFNIISSVLCMCFLALTKLSQFAICSTSDVQPAVSNYIVHMDITAMPKIFSSAHSWYSATLASLNGDDGTASSNSGPVLSSSKLIYTYTTSINGFSAVLSPAEHAAIANSPGFVSSVQDRRVELHTTHSYQFLGLNSYYGAWPESDYGKDVIIGVVDTGIWPESQSYNDDGMTEIPSRWKGICQVGTQFNSSMCNRKLIGARYFNKGLIASNPNLTIAMNSARDTNGHGTHTSSTAGGSCVEGASFFGYAYGNAKGMAPRARLAIYKILFDEGNTLSDLLAALDQAIMDGVDVLSLSLGLQGLPLYKDPISAATFEAVKNGIFVSASSGNFGPDLKTLANGIPWVLNVAAGIIDRVFQGIITMGDGSSVAGSTLFIGNFSSTEVTLAYIGGCENEKNLNRGKHVVVVCLDTTNVLLLQVDNVQKLKLLGAIFISNDSREFNELSEYIPQLPALFFNLADGRKILDYVKRESKPKATLTFHQTRIGKGVVAPKAAGFSLRGPSTSCPFVLKPDIMAPGYSILASWSPASPVAEFHSKTIYSNFNIISGTSMSCPHAAGVAALFKSAHPEWSPAVVRSAMMTTADALDNTGNPIKDYGSNDRRKAASPLVMGAGHINPNKALDPGLVYDVNSDDYVNLLCAMNFTSKQIRAIVRSPFYNCSSASLDLNYPSFIAYFSSNDTSSDAMVAQEFHREVTNVGKGAAVYAAELTALDGLTVSVSPLTLDFKETNEKKSYKLTIEGPRMAEDLLVYGYLTWVEIGGNHRVTSPIVATSLSTI